MGLDLLRKGQTKLTLELEEHHSPKDLEYSSQYFLYLEFQAEEQAKEWAGEQVEGQVEERAGERAEEKAKEQV